MTEEQRIAIDAYLKEHNYRFWLLLHCFFHSGARETEIVQVKVKDVDFNRRRIKYLIKKGANYREEYRPMKEIAVPYWQKAIQLYDKQKKEYYNAPPEYFVFSKWKQPGAKAVKGYQLNKSWRRWIKLKMGIDVDMYLLKHTNSTETAEMIGTKLAALHIKYTTGSRPVDLLTA